MHMKFSLCSLLFIFFLLSCGDDDTTITPLCITGDFSIKIDASSWESVGHFSNLRVEEDSITKKKELKLEIWASEVEKLILTTEIFHLLSSGTDPHSGCIEAGEYFVDSSRNNCLTSPGGNIDQCDRASLNYIKAGWPLISSEGVNVGSINISSCNKEEQTISGSFDITVENERQAISHQIVGQFTDVCYAIR